MDRNPKPLKTASEAAGRWWLGPGLTLGAIALSELINKFLLDGGGPSMTPSPLTLSAVLFAVFRGGLWPGLLGAALMLAHAALRLPAPGQSLLAPEVASRLGLLLVTVPGMVWLVARLKTEALANERLSGEHEAERRRAEALQSANEELAAQANALHSQQIELEALKKAEGLKTQFLGILSHELRTPINAITGFGSILEDELVGPLNETQRQYVHKLLAASDGLLALVDDLLDMTRVQAGKFTIAPARLRFGEVAERAIATIRPLAEKKAHHVVLQVPEELPELLADSQRLSQVLLNMLSNAVKFSPPGGRIVVRACQEGQGLRIEVSDTGPGIRPADQAKLFQRFTQLDMSTTRQAGGVGLGLSICKAIVEAHGGRIGVESAWGKGSVFWFWLPLSPATVTSTPPGG